MLTEEMLEKIQHVVDELSYIDLESLATDIMDIKNLLEEGELKDNLTKAMSSLSEAQLLVDSSNDILDEYNY